MSDATMGYLFRMQAKAGRGAELRGLLARVNDESADVESWLIGSEDADDDSLVGLEFYTSQAAADLHDQNPDVAAIQAQVGELLAGPPSRSVIHPTATSLSLLRP